MFVAHELAHVYQHAAGYWDGLSDVEADADRLVKAWGFSLSARGSGEIGDMAKAVAEELRAPAPQ